MAESDEQTKQSSRSWRDLELWPDPTSAAHLERRKTLCEKLLVIGVIGTLLLFSLAWIFEHQRNPQDEMVKINGLERIEGRTSNGFGWLSNFTEGPLGICGIILFSMTMGLGIHSRSIATQLASARKELDHTPAE